jgi:putative Holliday junction resolvase
MRIMGLDYGDKTIGVAVSDPRGIVAIGVETLRRTEELGLKKSMKRLAELVRFYEVNEIVLGYPKRMNNSEGERCEKTKAFKRKLENRFQGLAVTLWDERFSTIGAMRGLESVSKSKAEMLVDTMAAVFILQGYLDMKNSQRKEGEKMKDGDFDDDFEFEREYETIELEVDEGVTEVYAVLDMHVEEGGVYYLIVLEEDIDNDEAECSIIKKFDGEDEFEFVDGDEFDRIVEIFEAAEDEED